VFPRFPLEWSWFHLDLHHWAIHNLRLELFVRSVFSLPYATHLSTCNAVNYATFATWPGTPQKHAPLQTEHRWHSSDVLIDQPPHYSALFKCHPVEVQIAVVHCMTFAYFNATWRHISAHVDRYKWYFNYANLLIDRWDKLEMRSPPIAVGEHIKLYCTLW